MDNDKNSRLISDRANSISPSGIRKFFDLLGSIEGVISLGVGDRITLRRGIYVNRLSIP
jgi:hypothetical protein